MTFPGIGAFTASPRLLDGVGDPKVQHGYHRFNGFFFDLGLFEFFLELDFEFEELFSPFFLFLVSESFEEGLHFTPPRTSEEIQ